jgi:UDP-N-acetylglucosamine--N-acetylmuramyl-(pentapeptide) pyrophosphoryl-undecaprenol N-acetylglucosamine transferase
LSTRHRIVLTGGGTGGHVYPALSVAEQLRNDQNVEAILFCGATAHIEERLTAERNIPFVGLSVSGLPRSISGKALIWPFQFGLAVVKACKILQDFHPTAVLGTGGYASAPLLVAAQLLKIPFAIHEPDAHPGLVNRMMGPHAGLISLGMEGAKKSFEQSLKRIRVNGNPVSERFLESIPRTDAGKSLEINPELTTVLITGGSQGARVLNRAVYAGLPKLLNGPKAVQVLHQVGEKNWQDMESELPAELRKHPLYKPRPYFENLALAYAVSDLAVCRAGAMTISELSITGTPAIFVPLPSAAQDHQTFNAQSVASKGGAKVLMQKDLSGDSLSQTIEGMLQDKSTLAKMAQSIKATAKPEAAKRLSEQLKALSAGESMPD